jgi:hypothetical protein
VGKLADPKLIAVRQHDGPEYGVLQLPNVARPAMGAQ